MTATPAVAPVWDKYHNWTLRPPEMPTGTPRCLQFFLALLLACCPPGSDPVCVSQPSISRFPGQPREPGGWSEGWAVQAGCLLHLSPAHNQGERTLAPLSFPSLSPPLLPLTLRHFASLGGLGKYLRGQLEGQGGQWKQTFPSFSPPLSVSGALISDALVLYSLNTEALELERGSLGDRGGCQGWKEGGQLMIKGKGQGARELVTWLGSWMTFQSSSRAGSLCLGLAFTHSTVDGAEHGDACP